MNETNASYDNCIDACDACDTCAAGCLAESDTNPLARCIALDIECAQLCRVASGAMARRSTLAPQVCALCAQACEACAAMCRAMA
ncbi:four-helix bundle copper-binding protein [Burkholderia vietnamiensis]|uniref:four-helix bundle copper-binding protein n=1 Tax=Burkholderia vietnamiensis TaxID=60552 RepID=UPI00387E7183